MLSKDSIWNTCLIETVGYFANLYATFSIGWIRSLAVFHYNLCMDSEQRNSELVFDSFAVFLFAHFKHLNLKISYWKYCCFLRPDTAFSACRIRSLAVFHDNLCVNFEQRNSEPVFDPFSVFLFPRITPMNSNISYWKRCFFKDQNLFCRENDWFFSFSTSLWILSDLRRALIFHP